MAVKWQSRIRRALDVTRLKKERLFEQRATATVHRFVRGFLGRLAKAALKEISSQKKVFISAESVSASFSNWMMMRLFSDLWSVSRLVREQTKNLEKRRTFQETLKRVWVSQGRLSFSRHPPSVRSLSLSLSLSLRVRKRLWKRSTRARSSDSSESSLSSLSSVVSFCGVVFFSHLFRGDRLCVRLAWGNETFFVRPLVTSPNTGVARSTRGAACARLGSRFCTAAAERGAHAAAGSPDMRTIETRRVISRAARGVRRAVVGTSLSLSLSCISRSLSLSLSAVGMSLLARSCCGETCSSSTGCDAFSTLSFVLFLCCAVRAGRGPAVD